MSFPWLGPRLRHLLRDERGIALPTALFATIASLGLAGAAVMSSIDVQHGSRRDNGSKSAIAAADAGANIAMQRLNRYGAQLDGENVCINLDDAGGSEELKPGGTPVGEPGWCAPIEGEVGGATYSYRVSAIGGGDCEDDVCVVSTGTANEVSRRIELSLDAAGLGTGGVDPERAAKEVEWLERHGANQKTIKEAKERWEQAQQAASSAGGIAGLVGREGISMSGNAYIGLGVATNGYLETSGSVDICGDVQVGIGKSWKYSGHKSQCAGHTFTQGNMEVPQVSSFIPSDIATHNSNGRLTVCNKGLPLECQKDTYNGKWSSTEPFNPTTRSINLSGSKTLTVGGGDYWICSITLSGSQELIMAAGSHVRFFFDTPEHCGTSSQIAISGNSKIVSTGYNSATKNFSVPGFYLLGSATKTSSVSISGTSSGNEFIVYGPNSTIGISGNASKGIVVGKSITISGSVRVEQDEGFEVPPELNPGHIFEQEALTFQEKKEKAEKEEKALEEEEEKWNAEHPGEPASAPTFSAQSYVECTGGSAPPNALPNADC